MVTSLEEAHATAEERQGEARAKYNFNAQTGLELTLKKVTVVMCSSRVVMCTSRGYMIILLAMFLFCDFQLNRGKCVIVIKL